MANPLTLKKMIFRFIDKKILKDKMIHSGSTILQFFSIIISLIIAVVVVFISVLIGLHISYYIIETAKHLKSLL
jgi:ABC-type spermidine/putrescine transport system permease subunit I